MQLRPAVIDSNTRAKGTIVQLIKRFIHSATIGRGRVRFPMVSLEFYIGIILLAALWHWDRLSL
jgi:hypothetical protein